MELNWENHNEIATDYPLWCQELQNKKNSGQDLSNLELLLLAKTAHDTNGLDIAIFDQALAQLSTIKSFNAQESAYYHYLLALNERSFNRLEQARDRAKECVEMAKGMPFHPIAQSLYALYLVESKKIHLGLELLQEIHVSPNPPHLAKRSVLTNLITFSIELGIGSALKQYYPEAQKDYKLRCDIFLAIIRGDHTYLASILETPPIDYKFYKISLGLCDLISYLTLVDDQKLNTLLHKSWILDYLKPFHHDPLFRRMAILCGAELELNNNEKLSPSWFSVIRVHYLDALIALKNNELVLAKKIFSEKISPLAEELRLSNPLIPHLCYGRLVPDSPVSQLLSKKIGELSLDKKVEKLQVGIRDITYQKGNEKIEIDFSKSIKSLTLLRILAGDEGHRVSKEQIHNALSSEPYHPLEHDSRLHKLLDRLQKRLIEEGIPELWYKPGDNNIVLKKRIEII